MPFTKKQGRYALGALAAYESAMAYGRFEDRKRLFAQARVRANQLHRPLVVVGDPDGGAHTRLLRAYPCGDVTIDLHGAPSCPVSISADITRPVAEVAADSSVVYVSCVFEYVDDPVAAYRECLRMAGSPQNVFIVRVSGATLTSRFYPGAKWTIDWNSDGTPRFEPVTTTSKLFAAAVVAGVAYVAVKGK